MSRASRVVGRFARGGVLLVPTRVNGQDFEFLVDTGSAYSGLASAVAEYLGLVPRHHPGVRIAPAHGSVIRVPTTRVNSLSVGGREMTNLDVLILDLPKDVDLDGLLGMDFLGRFRVALEPETASLILREARKL